VNWLGKLALLNEPVKRAATKAGHGTHGTNTKQTLAVNGDVLDFHWPMLLSLFGAGQKQKPITPRLGV